MTLLALHDTLAALKGSNDTVVAPFRHGTLEVHLYKPHQVDPQIPHTRDELYVVAEGAAEFVCGPTQDPVEPGDVLFVAAGVEHRFVTLSDDFAVWVFFYGPEGGEPLP
jgi:mannose-6-phosphate isomerase-like protein (cupin superfamily)